MSILPYPSSSCHPYHLLPFHPYHLLPFHSYPLFHPWSFQETSSFRGTWSFQGTWSSLETLWYPCSCSWLKGFRVLSGFGVEFKVFLRRSVDGVKINLEKPSVTFLYSNLPVILQDPTKIIITFIPWNSCYTTR